MKPDNDSYRDAFLRSRNREWLWEIQVQTALVVGVGEYGEGIQDLPNAAGDARAVADLLSSEFGFKLLPSGSALLDAVATQEEILTTVETSLAEAGPQGRWLFYFAGHGLVDGEKGFLLPVDAQVGRSETYLNLGDLIHRCMVSKCAEALIILDACYAGQVLLRPEDLSDLIPRGEAGNRVRQVITSGNPDQPVLDAGGSGHSLFTQALLDALQGWAGIQLADGSIQFMHLLDYMGREVRKRQLSLRIPGPLQQPVGGNLIGNRWRRDFVFRSTVPRLSPEAVLGGQSGDAARRRENLERLVEECRLHPERGALGLQLASRSLDPTLELEPSVRARAAWALGELGNKEGVEALAEALEDEPGVSRSAAQALGRLANPRAAQPLLDHLAGAPLDLFLDLVDAIGALDEPQFSLRALAHCLRGDLLVPFIGPDLPPALSGFLDRASLATKLAQRSGQVETGSLAQAAAGSLQGNSRFTFIDFLKHTLVDPIARPGAFFLSLARLGVRLWVSGAWDGCLAQTLSAYQVVMGEDTLYLPIGQPVVVQLVGDLARLRGVVILEEDYRQLREDEADRRLLVDYLRRNLAGKIILFLGCDPSSLDFSLLVRYVLNQHLAGLEASAFLIWPEEGQRHTWNDKPVRQIHLGALEAIQELARLAG